MKELESKNVHLDPDEVIEGAIGKLQQVVILGISNEGDVWVASSVGVPSTFFLMEMAKKTLTDMIFEEKETVN